MLKQNNKYNGIIINLILVCKLNFVCKCDYMGMAVAIHNLLDFPTDEQRPRIVV